MSFPVCYGLKPYSLQAYLFKFRGLGNLYLFIVDFNEFKFMLRFGHHAL